MTAGSPANPSNSGSNPSVEPGRVPRPKPDRDQQGALAWVPGFHAFRHYRLGWLPHDFTAGLVLTAVMVPVGMAYAQAAGLPPIVGLYASIFPLFAYAVFGPSRILVVGPDSALTPMIATAIVPLAAGNVPRAMALAAALAILSGLICIFVGVARLGFITELLSKPIRHGYMNGIALMVLVSQLPRLFGFSAGGDNLPSRLMAIGNAMAHGYTNLAALAIGAATLIVVLFLKRWKKVPGVLIAVVAATLVATVLDLGNRAAVPVVGLLPQGLPGPAVPAIRLADLLPLAAAAVAIAAVSVAQTSVLSRTYAVKLNDYVDPNREMVGLGMSNLAAGVFQGFPINSAVSRTPVAEDAGSRSQLTGVFGALFVAALLVAAPSLLKNVPNAALAGVVIAAAIGLFEVADLPRLYRMRPSEFWLSLICFAGVVLFGAVPGILFAIAVAVAEFLWEAWRPHHAVLGRVDGVKGYHDIARHPEARRVPGLVLFRWDAPLFFANAEQFRSSVLDAVDESPTPVRWLVITAEPVTNVDTTAAEMLDRLHDDLAANHICLGFAAMKGPAKDRLKRYALYNKIGDERFFRTVGEAVNAYVRAEEVDWVDWEERLAATKA